VLLFTALLALMWALLGLAERRDFDRSLRQVRADMTEQQVLSLMGAPSARLQGEAEVERHQQRANEWWSDFTRPMVPSGAVLAFTADERKAYVYLDDSGRVEAVLLAHRGQSDRFFLMEQDSGP
jgi:hypothetical protein